jgi:hypothetical protein
MLLELEAFNLVSCVFDLNGTRTWLKSAIISTSLSQKYKTTLISPSIKYKLGQF